MATAKRQIRITFSIGRLSHFAFDSASCVLPNTGFSIFTSHMSVSMFVSFNLYNITGEHLAS